MSLPIKELPIEKEFFLSWANLKKNMIILVIKKYFEVKMWHSKTLNVV